MSFHGERALSILFSRNPIPLIHRMTNAEPSNVDTWSQRVSAYVDELAELAETIDLILDETRVRTIGLKPGEVDASTESLAKAIAQLEQMIARRDELIRDPLAPAEGLSLSEKLLHTRRIEDARLARRCGEVAQVIDTTHSRATALFVCQYHLSHLQTELLQQLAGFTAPATYEAGGRSTPAPRSSDAGSGGLFNDAA